MKKFLLSVAAMAAMVPSFAQTTYNFFDPADCDADGWLWFDSQEKLDKYCGFGSKYKIMLMSTTAEDADGQFPEPELDGTIDGYNVVGELGGEGAKIGAIIVPKSNSWTSKDGGSIVLFLPDCASFNIFMSSENDLLPYVSCKQNEWLDENLWSKDITPVKSYMHMIGTSLWAQKMGFPAQEQKQYKWLDIQNLKDDNTGATIASPIGQKVTARITNAAIAPLLIQGIRVFTYTNTQGNSAIEDIIADGTSIVLSGKTLVANAVCDMKVYAADGKLVASAHASTLDLSNLPAGIYVAKAGEETVKIKL